MSEESRILHMLAHPRAPFGKTKCGLELDGSNLGDAVCGMERCDCIACLRVAIAEALLAPGGVKTHLHHVWNHGKWGALCWFGGAPLELLVNDDRWCTCEECLKLDSAGEVGR